MDIFANGINSQLNILNLIMQKNYLLFNLLVLLFGMTFNGLVVQPSSAAVMANDYTPAVTEDEVSVFLETSYDNAKIWAWNDKVKQFTTAAWPGDVATHVVSDVETVATKVILLRAGKIVDAAPVPELIEKYAPGQGLEDVYLNVFGEGDGK